MTDDMIRALGKNGGVIGINYGCGFLDVEYRKRAEASKKPDPTGGPTDPEALAAWRYQKMSQAPSAVEPPPLASLIDHIDHAVVAGVDHVGLGSDFDGVPSLPKGMEDVSRLPAITDALLARGYKESDVREKSSAATSCACSRPSRASEPSRSVRGGCPATDGKIFLPVRSGLVRHAGDRLR